MNSPSQEDSLVTPLEAAHFLGITPELLFAYVRFPPKMASGHDRRLPTVQHAGQTMFKNSDLKDFDVYLTEPWSGSATDRPAIPSYISDYLKVECGGQCPRCGKGFKLENAHISDYAQSRSHHHHNLIRLCSHCHDEFDSKQIIQRDEITALKARLVDRVRKWITQTPGGWSSAIAAVPAPAPIFVGRAAEMTALSNAIASCRTLCIQGPPGIGKTQLTLNALIRSMQGRLILWVEVGTFSGVSDLEFGVRTALSPFGSASTKTPLAHLLDERQICVVFDGVEAIATDHLDDLEDFFTSLTKNAPGTKGRRNNNCPSGVVSLSISILKSETTDRSAYELIPSK